MSLAIDLPDDPGVDALAPDDRALVARIWTERSAAEQRAAVIFTMIARDLLVGGDALGIFAEPRCRRAVEGLGHP